MSKVAVMIISLVVMGVGYAKEMKIGVLDFQRVISESPIAKKMNDDLQKKYKPRQDEMISLQSKLKNKGAKSEEKASELQRNESVMKAPQIRKLRGEIESLNTEILSLRRDLERKGEYFQTDLQQDQAKASKKFSEQVDAKVKKIGESDNFDVILQKQATVYVRKSKHDITDRLIKSLK